MQVGTTKDQGLYNKPSAAVHLGALAAGTLPQYNTIQMSSLLNLNKYLIMVCYINCLVSGPFQSSNSSKITKNDMMCCFEHCTIDKVQDIHCTVFSILKLLPLTAPFFHTT